MFRKPRSAIASCLASFSFGASADHYLQPNECAALATYGEVVAEQRDAGKPIAEVLHDNYSLRSEFSSADLFGATIYAVHWVYRNSSIEPKIAFDNLWHLCADNTGRIKSTDSSDSY